MENYAKDVKVALPAFLGVGPPRTGTSWLDSIFRGHINLPDGIKETLFFDLRYARGIDWYASHFRNQRAGVPTGEFAPSCFTSGLARERIAHHIPDCKIICTLRDPVERLYSNYRMWRKLALVKDPFPDVAERHQALLSYTRYTDNIAAWQRMFGRDNTLVLIHADLLADRQAYVDRICTFIGAPKLDLAKLPKVDAVVARVERAPKNRRMARRARQFRGFLSDHRFWRTRKLIRPLFDFCTGRGEVFPPLDPPLARRLRQHFEPEIASCEELLGRDLSIWRNPLSNA